MKLQSTSWTLTNFGTIDDRRSYFKDRKNKNVPLKWSPGVYQGFGRVWLGYGGLVLGFRHFFLYSIRNKILILWDKPKNLSSCPMWDLSLFRSFVWACIQLFRPHIAYFSEDLNHWTNEDVVPTVLKTRIISIIFQGYVVDARGERTCF